MVNLSEYKKEQKLVQIRRDGIDFNEIQGFILDFSDELVAIQYVYDFNLDGLLIIRRSDITEVKCSKTDEFQKILLINEGLFQKIEFNTKFRLDSWQSVLNLLSNEYKYLIIEEESKSDDEVFLIGKIQKINNSEITFNFFSGAANWDDKPIKISTKNITCCQVNTNYLNVYQRYFNSLSKVE